MKTPLVAAALLLLLPLAACSSGDEAPEDPTPSESSSAAPDADAELPVPTGRLCEDLDTAAVAQALGVGDLRVETDAIAGENGAGGFPVLAPQCTLRGGGVALDLSIGAVDADGDLSDDVTESLDAAAEQGFQECEELRTVEGFDGREAVGYDCEIPQVELEASTIAVRMAPTWLLSCALSGPVLEAAQTEEGLPGACTTVADALAS